nr:YbjN domain-containing protein [uncultured Roseovarius sp.]
MRRLVLSALAGLFMTSPALAEVDGSKPWQIASMLQEAGYRAQMDVASDDTPMIRSTAERINFVIFFFGCEQEQGCNSIQYSAGFDMADGLSVSKMNEWNRTKRFGKVYLDAENDPFIQMDVNLNFGVSDKNFMDSFDYWLLVLELFDEYRKS